MRAKQRLQMILPVVFFVIFLLLYLVFHSVAETLVLIFPTIYAMSGGLLLQWFLKYNFSVAVAVGYIALFGIAVETGVVMVVYLHEALERKLQSGKALTNADVEAAAIEGAVQRLRPKPMTVFAVLASLVPILWESGIGSDVMKPISAPIVGGMITSTIHVLILVPVFFVMMKERALRKGHLHPQNQSSNQTLPQSTGNSRTTLMRLRISALFLSAVLSAVAGLRSIQPDSNWNCKRRHVRRASHDEG